MTRHEDDINRLAEGGLTNGCSPSYCPTATLTRGQIAALLFRALAP